MGNAGSRQSQANVQPSCSLLDKTSPQQADYGVTSALKPKRFQQSRSWSNGALSSKALESSKKKWPLPRSVSSNAIDNEQSQSCADSSQSSISRSSFLRRMTLKRLSSSFTHTPSVPLDEHDTSVDLEAPQDEPPSNTVAELPELMTLHNRPDPLQEERRRALETIASILPEALPEDLRNSISSRHQESQSPVPASPQS